MASSFGYLMDLFSLRGRVALVTGGGSGIGRAIAGGLARAGASIVVIARTEANLVDVCDEIAASGARGAWVAADLADRDALAAAADRATESFGEPDILVCAAGINLRPPLAELTPEVWDATMALNVDAAFLLGQRFGPRMAAGGWGRIINIGSQQSIRAFGNSGAYGVSKAAVVALTRSQAEAWSAAGVCCNAIMPGFVETPMTTAVSSDPERLAALAARTMTGRNGVPQDMVGAAIFLASPAASYITGQPLFVDGGFSAS
jgi:NAD(P)-dependent dehydrogenase (short-subunit alcohol dehydrogenase family)